MRSIARPHFSLLRRRRFFLAAVVARAFTLVAALAAFFIVFFLSRGEPSQIVAVGKPMIPLIGALGVVTDAAIDAHFRKRKHAFHVVRRRRRRAT